MVPESVQHSFCDQRLTTGLGGLGLGGSGGGLGSLEGLGGTFSLPAIASSCLHLLAGACLHLHVDSLSADVFLAIVLRWVTVQHTCTSH